MNYKISFKTKFMILVILGLSDFSVIEGEVMGERDAWVRSLKWQFRGACCEASNDFVSGSDDVDDHHISCCPSCSACVVVSCQLSLMRPTTVFSGFLRDAIPTPIPFFFLYLGVYFRFSYFPVTLLDSFFQFFFFFF